MKGDLVRELTPGSEVCDLFAQLLKRPWVLQHVVQDGTERNGRRVGAREHVCRAAG